MLMGIFVEFLRRPVSPAEEATVPDQHSKKDSVLSSKMLKELVRKLGDDAMMAVPPQRVIFKEGGAAMLMYVILEGTVSARVDNKVVNKSSAGDIIGEIALVDQKPRTASVIAETHCSLLAINRQTLLELIQSMPEFGIALLRVLASRSSLHSSAPKSADDWDWD
jgi:CRP-like cAMP-binding protein